MLPFFKDFRSFLQQEGVKAVRLPPKPARLRVVVHWNAAHFFPVLGALAITLLSEAKVPGDQFVDGDAN